MGISTHVLDLANGRPAPGVPVWLTRSGQPVHRALTGHDATDHDGRCHLLTEPPTPGTYTLHFDTSAFFAAQNLSSLYPTVDVTFVVQPGQTHYHIPLLLTANGYTTYRGS